MMHSKPAYSLRYLRYIQPPHTGVESLKESWDFVSLQVQLYALIWIGFPADCQTDGWRGRERGKRLNNRLTSAASEISLTGATGTITLDFYLVFGLGRDWWRTEGLDQSDLGILYFT